MTIEKGKMVPSSNFYMQILAIKKIADIILKTRLFSIIVVSGETSRGREYCQKMMWNIDDGCMRAVALTLSGREKVNAYVGMRARRDENTCMWLLVAEASGC